MPFLAGYITPQDFGAVGNGVADDTAAVQAAVTFLQNAGGGTLFYPEGTYLCTPTASPAVSVSANGIRMVGSSEGASTIKKNGNGVLFSFTGTTSPSSGATHVRNCSIENLSFNGNSLTGSIIQLYYADNFYARDVNISSNSDVVVDCVEFWDSRFFNTAIVNCGGGVNSATAPNVWIRNSSAASGVGASTGNSNNIHFIGCRFEGSLTGAIWIAQGTSNSSNPNNIKVVSCKFEADAIQGGPLVQADNTTKAVVIDDCNFQLGGFAGGYSTAQRVISYGGGNHVISNCTIGNSGSATISDGLFLHAVGGSSITVENVIGGYTTNPTVSHVNFDVTATGSYSVSNTPTSGGTQFGGTPPSMLFNLPRNLLVGANAALGDNGVGEIQLANAATNPTTNPTGGLTAYANAGQLLARNPQGLVQTLSSAIQAQTSTTTVTGVTAETVLHTVTIPANDPATGAVYHMTGYGVYTGVSGTLDFITRWGGVAGTLIASVSTAFTVVAATNIPFWYDVTVTFRSTTSCAAAINLEMAQTATGGADNAISYVGSPAAATTVTTTGSSALVVDVLPSVSTTSVSLLGGCVRRLA